MKKKPASLYEKKAQIEAQEMKGFEVSVGGFIGGKALKIYNF